MMSQNKPFVFPFVKPDVEVVSVLDNRAFAWKVARNDQYADITNWRTKDFAIHDMMMVTVHFRKASVAFRELMTIFRPYNMWAASSRDEHPTKMELIDLGWDEGVKSELQSQMNKALTLTDTEGLDKGRMEYPLALSRGWTIQMSYRLWMMFFKALQTYAPRYFEHYARPVIHGLDMTVEEFNKLEYRDNIGHHHALDTSDEQESTYVGEYVYLRMRGAFGWVSQLVRQRQAKVLTNYWTYLLDCKDELVLELMTQGQPIDVSIMTHKSHYESVAKTRSCFTFHRELWNEFVKPFHAKMIKEGTPHKIYPCDGDVSKCFTEPEARAAQVGRFGYYPCPVMNGSKFFLDRYKEDTVGIVDWTGDDAAFKQLGLDEIKFSHDDIKSVESFRKSDFPKLIKVVQLVDQNIDDYTIHVVE